jgi:hypothetical protein
VNTFQETEDGRVIITLRAKVKESEEPGEKPYYEISLPEIGVTLRTNYLLNVEPVARDWVKKNVPVARHEWVFDTKIRVTPELEKAACKECGRA